MCLVLVVFIDETICREREESFSFEASKTSHNFMMEILHWRILLKPNVSEFLKLKFTRNLSLTQQTARFGKNIYEGFEYY